MSHLIHERPYANELMGAQSTGPVTGGADWICRQPDHWLFEGSGMVKGEAFPDWWDGSGMEIQPPFRV